jgi:Rha family phage regulatory protein
MSALQLVYHNDNKLVTDSRKIAAVFNKEHSSVLKSVEKAMSRLPKDFNDGNFSICEITEKSPGGFIIRNKHCLLTKDAFTLVVMGFTGEKAMKFKLDFLNEFNRMAQQLGQLTVGGNPVFVFMENALHLLKSHDSEIQALKEKVRHLEAVKAPEVKIQKGEPSRKIIDDAVGKRLAALSSINPNALAAIRGALKRRYQVDRYYECPIEDAIEYIKTWTYGMYY